MVLSNDPWDGAYFNPRAIIRTILVGPQGLPNYTETGPVVSDKKVFKVFYIDVQGK